MGAAIGQEGCEPQKHIPTMVQPEEETGDHCKTTLRKWVTMVASREGNPGGLKKRVRETPLYTLLHLWEVLPCAPITFFFFFFKWFKSFSRVSHESGTEVNQMDPVSTGLIPGLPFRQDSPTVSEGPGWL